MYLIKNDDQITDIVEIIQNIEGSEKNVCLKSKEGEEFLVNKVLTSIIWPSLGAVLDGDDPVMVVPLEMRVLRMVMEIKLRGFVNVSEQNDVERIMEAFDIFGDNVNASQFTMNCSESAVKENIEFLFENFEDEATAVVEHQVPNIVTESPQDYDDNAPMDKVGPNTESKEFKVDVIIKVEDGDHKPDYSFLRSEDQVKRQKKAALKVRDKCGDCKFYSRRGAIRQHILEVHTDKVPLDKENFQDKSIITKLSIDSKIKLENKKANIKTEGSVDTTCCNICKMSIPRGSMTRHVKSIHPERDLIHCKICEFECLYKSTLTAHMESIHKKKTKCDFCEMEVKKMEIHLDKYHSEEPNKYHCKYCDFSSFDEKRVFKHSKKQHESTKGKCEKCNKTFRNITNHQRKHTINKFECIPCSKTFSVKRDLCRHILYRHENKKNSCKVCGKTSVTNLMKHVKFNHPDMASSVEDDERLDRDRIWIQLGEAWQYFGV